MRRPFRDELDAAHERIARLSCENAALRATPSSNRLDWFQRALFGLIALCTVALVYLVVGVR